MGDSRGNSGGGVQQPRDQDILSKGKPPVTSSKDRKTVAETATLVTARPAAVIDTTSTSEGDTDQDTGEESEEGTDTSDGLNEYDVTLPPPSSQTAPLKTAS